MGTGEDHRRRDRQIWEGIFRDAPDPWKSAPPSEPMRECASFLQTYGAENVLDLGSGFGRWTRFLADDLGCRVVGVDSAVGGSRLGLKLARQPSRSPLLAAEITHLPFPSGTFDGFVAALILDNVAEAEGRLAVREVGRVVRSGSPGFVMLNPWPMPESADDAENPTRGCTRRDYRDHEAVGILLSEWQVLSWARGEHGFRLFRVRV